MDGGRVCRVHLSGAIFSAGLAAKEDLVRLSGAVDSSAERLAAHADVLRKWIADIIRRQEQIFGGGAAM
jgi:hypothetical protein